MELDFSRCRNAEDVKKVFRSKNEDMERVKEIKRIFGSEPPQSEPCFPTERKATNQIQKGVNN